MAEHSRRSAQIALLSRSRAGSLPDEELANALAELDIANASDAPARAHLESSRQVAVPPARLTRLRKQHAPARANAALALNADRVLQVAKLEQACEPSRIPLSDASNQLRPNITPALKSAGVKRFAQKSSETSKRPRSTDYPVQQKKVPASSDAGRPSKVTKDQQDAHTSSVEGDVRASPGKDRQQLAHAPQLQSMAAFQTANDQLNAESKGGKAGTAATCNGQSTNVAKPFQCPIGSNAQGVQGTVNKAVQNFSRGANRRQQQQQQQQEQHQQQNEGEDEFSEDVLAKLCPNGGEIPESVNKLDKHLVERICSEICDRPQNIQWSDIAGLEHVKNAVQEIAVWPMLKPHLFTGARAVPRGMLLFGPPGTGKTLIGRAVASQCCATFFSISSSSLTSKWIGEAEKLVRALFTIAIAVQPSVVFVDEIDSILSARKAEGEHESSRRLKTELMVQMEGISGDDAHQVLLIGATNRPQEMDDAARRRMPKQLHVPLPCLEARREIVNHMLKRTRTSLSEEQMHTLCEKTNGYSASDMKHLVQEAARAPLREVLASAGDPTRTELNEESIRPVSLSDFKKASKQVRPTVTEEEVTFHREWDRMHGARALQAREGEEEEEENDEDDWGV
jgi:AAA+ superfamily predicted ATPase